MSLSNIPDWMLIDALENWTPIPGFREDDIFIGLELDNRYPEDQYGECDNRLEFLPTEPEWDDKPIEEMEYYEENL